MSELIIPNNSFRHVSVLWTMVYRCRAEGACSAVRGKSSQRLCGFSNRCEIPLTRKLSEINSLKIFFRFRFRTDINWTDDLSHSCSHRYFTLNFTFAFAFVILKVINSEIILFRFALISVSMVSNSAHPMTGKLVWLAGLGGWSLQSHSHSFPWVIGKLRWVAKGLATQ